VPIVLQTGNGSLRIANVEGRSVLLSSRATSPLRLIETRGEGSAVWIFSTTFGGGLVEGDRIELDVDVGEGARALLTTQASTKVFRSLTKPTANVLRARVGRGGLFASIPDATVCFEGARFEQQVSVELAEDASACVLDVLHAGRVARGERWAMASYRNEVSVTRDGEPIIRDALRLDPAHGSIEARMGRFDVLATLVLVGPAFAAARARIREEIDARPARVLESCNERGDLLLVRFAARDAEAAHTRLRTLLVEVSAIVGDVLARKR